MIPLRIRLRPRYVPAAAIVAARGSALVLGFAAVLVAAVGFAVSTVAGARIVGPGGISDATVLVFRFGVATLVLTAVAARQGRLRPHPSERRPLLVLGTVVYALEATLFIAALGQASAGAVTVLFYAYPAMVAVFEMAIRVTPVQGRLILSIAGAGGGMAVVSLGSGRDAINLAGALLALGAAFAFSVYLIGSSRCLVRTPALTRAVWVCGGATVAVLGRGLATGALALPHGAWPEIVVIGVTTSGSFGFLFVGLERIGATRCAVALTAEPVIALVLAAMVDDSPLGPAQLIGGTMIVVAAVLAARPPQRRARTRLAGAVPGT